MAALHAMLGQATLVVAANLLTVVGAHLDDVGIIRQGNGFEGAGGVGAEGHGGLAVLNVALSDLLLEVSNGGTFGEVSRIMARRSLLALPDVAEFFSGASTDPANRTLEGNGIASFVGVLVLAGTTNVVGVLLNLGGVVSRRHGGHVIDSGLLIDL